MQYGRNIGHLQPIGFMLMNLALPYEVALNFVLCNWCVSYAVGDVICIGDVICMVMSYIFGGLLIGTVQNARK